MPPPKKSLSPMSVFRLLFAGEFHELRGARARLAEGDEAVAVQHRLLPAQDHLGRAVVGTGIALGLPGHLAALTLPRSGLAARHGISIVNAPGLIDPGYRGEVRIILANTVPHHAITMQVPLALLGGMLDAVCDTVLATVPAHAEEERAVWNDLRAALTNAVNESMD